MKGIDLNEDLLRKAKSGKIHPELHFQKGNMLDLENDFQENQFDAVLCFGNTLVHLQNIELVSQMLKGVYSVMKKDGQILIPILNYDYILNKVIIELPLIETENIQFIRKYSFEDNNLLIRFKTELVLQKEN